MFSTKILTYLFKLDNVYCFILNYFFFDFFTIEVLL